MLHEHIWKGFVMPKVRKRKSPQELAALILEHSPGASIEMMTSVISEWGGLLDDDLLQDRRSSVVDWPKANRRQQSPRSSAAPRSP